MRRMEGDLKTDSRRRPARSAMAFGLLGFLGLACGAADAAVRIEGQVQAGGGPVAGSMVTLWAGSAGEPKQLAQARTADDGSFALNADATPGPGVSLYLVAKGGVASVNKSAGDNPALAFLAVLGGAPPAKVVVNEMTTIASVWTNAQFLDGAAIKGPALSLSIAAGNVPNFVDLSTGGWGSSVQDPLNSSQTPTMANFATLADALAGCATQVTPIACDMLFAAAKSPTGGAPGDTLMAAQSIARAPWYLPGRAFALLDAFYPVPIGKNSRPVPFMPYLNTAPSAWVLPLKFDGGGYRAGGKAMFDSEGNLWVGDNFTIGWQGSDALWQGHATKFAPNGRPLSPITTGFAGGGMEGGTFGAAIDANDNAWLTSYGSKSITVFDKTGKPLTPPDGITFGGRLGLMQGVIVTPSGDVWALGVEKSSARFLSQRRPDQGPDRLRGRQRRAVQVVSRAIPSRHRPARPDLGQQQRRRPCHALSGVRPQQSRDLQGRLQQQRPRNRQSGRRLGHRPVRQRADWHDAHGRLRASL